MGTFIGKVRLINHVKVSALAVKQLRKMPFFIVDKFYLWKRSVEDIGLEKVREIPGYHDEKLIGNRRGHRSIRLNKAYRAIYDVASDGTVTFVRVFEVNKHEY
jgi:proteic killer suppression protein